MKPTFHKQDMLLLVLLRNTLYTRVVLLLHSIQCSSHEASQQRSSVLAGRSAPT